MEYIGDLITCEEKMNRPEICYSENNLGCYVLDFLYKGKTFINGKRRAFFKAKYDILKNTELVWNYGDRKRAIMEHNPWLKSTKKSPGIYLSKLRGDTTLHDRTNRCFLYLQEKHSRICI